MSGPGLANHFRDPGLLALYPPFSYREPSERRGVPYRGKQRIAFLFLCYVHHLGPLSHDFSVTDPQTSLYSPAGGNARMAPDVPALLRSLRGIEHRAESLGVSARSG